MEPEILTRRLALMEYIRCFQRKEMKYRLNVRQQNRLMARLWPFLKPDEYGAYTIGSLYLDTPDYLFIRRSLDKPIYKEKLRLRAYGVPRGEDMVFLELKKKWKGIVYKRRIALPLPQAEAYLQDGVPPAETGQIFREIDYVRRLYTPMPRVYVAYDRLAYTGGRIRRCASPSIRGSAGGKRICGLAQAARARRFLSRTPCFSRSSCRTPCRSGWRARCLKKGSSPPLFPRWAPVTPTSSTAARRGGQKRLNLP